MMSTVAIKLWKPKYHKLLHWSPCTGDIANTTLKDWKKAQTWRPEPHLPIGDPPEHCVRKKKSSIVLWVFEKANDLQCESRDNRTLCSWCFYQMKAYTNSCWTSRSFSTSSTSRLIYTIIVAFSSKAGFIETIYIFRLPNVIGNFYFQKKQYWYSIDSELTRKYLCQIKNVNNQLIIPQSSAKLAIQLK